MGDPNSEIKNGHGGGCDEIQTQQQQQNDDESKETDKMLKDPSGGGGKTVDEKKNDDKIPLNGNSDGGEIIKQAPENACKVSAQERECKPKKIPIGGVKIPGFFTKNKPNIQNDKDGGESGELLDNTQSVETKAIEAAENEKNTKTQNVGLLSSLRNSLRNPFRKQAKNEDEEKGLTKDDEHNGGEQKQNELNDSAANKPQKKIFLNAIRLPLANMIPKRLRNSDIEMGNGPNTRAGLASMETLDDSQKDNDKADQVDHAVIKNDDGLENVKLDNGDDKEKNIEKSDIPKEKPPSCWERIRSYQCSVDDWAIAGGIVLFFLLVLVIVLLAFSGTPSVKEPALRNGKFVDAITSCGLVEGILEDGAFAFRGIPYAIPPVNESRWKPAELIQDIDYCWNETLKAHNSSAYCPQIYANGTISGDEDCLTLDIVTPHIRYDNPLPVVVLIGAESMIGDSPGRMRPSTRYARARDVIFVRPNFRLGAHGFLALDVLSKSTHPPTSGNYGLSDIIAALKWIQLNIVHFGGDPKSVTLFGHRAGGTLVTALVTSPKTKDLYTRSWVSSGAAIFPGRPLSESENANSEYLTNIECTDADCLRRAENKAILEAIPDTWRQSPLDLPKLEENTTIRHNWLVLDGDILQKHPADSWNNEAGPIKMVIGTTSHESHSEKLYFLQKEWTPELVKSHIEESIIGNKGLTQEVLKLYPQTYQGLIRMVSDIRTVCPLLTIASLQASTPFYIVTQTTDHLNIADVSADVAAIFGRYEPKTPEQRRYVSAMQQLFYHYVSHGEMKQYEMRRGILEIGQDALLRENYPNCDFWIKHDMVPRFARLD